MYTSVRAFGASLIFALFAAPSAWAAPYVWVTTEGAVAQAHVGELLPGRGDTTLPTLKEPRALLADGKELPVQEKDGGYAITLPDADVSGDLRFTAKSLDKDDVLTVFATKSGRAETKPVNDLELVPVEANGNRFRLIWKGKPVAAAVVGVQTSAGWRRTLRADEDGTVSLVSEDYPDLFPSVYVLNATVKLNGEMMFDDKKYDQVRYTATLAFEVSKP